MLKVSDSWREKVPGACVGCMVVEQVANPAQCEQLDEQKGQLEAELRKTYTSREKIAELATMQAYQRYYKQFGKNYHVLAQLESVAVKGKPIPQVAALVEAMFMAELKNGLLTAGHDYEALRLPLTMAVATGAESYEMMNGKVQAAKAGDMAIADSAGIISSVLHGPDSRTRIVPTTRKAVFIIYAPPGIAPKSVLAHLSDVYFYIKLISPEAVIELQKVYPDK
ncbi:MAG TPA: hypothetical protein VN631_12590 [Negativicutes bacterium]|nr:hypothetical protein [Negativicutes bacterium]